MHDDILDKAMKILFIIATAMWIGLSGFLIFGMIVTALYE